MSSPERTAALLERILPREALGASPARDGLPALPLASPRELEQWSEVVRLAGRERLALVPLGLGSKLSWCRPPERADLVLSSADFCGVEAYEPADGTITARAGTVMAELARVAAGGGHQLSPDVACPERATLGGTLAAGASGLDRLRHGPSRHQVLGMRAVLPDGTLVKSGGRVVKNVTGYDLHRLWCGSQGTLCALLEISLRLYPLPASQAVVSVACERRDQALERAQELARSPLAPLALVVHDRAADRRWQLALVLAGREEVVRFELERALELLPGCEVARDVHAARAREGLRDLELETGRWPPLWIACRPSRLGSVLGRLDEAARDLGLAARLALHPLLASAAVWLEPQAGTALAPGQLLALQRALSSPSVQLQWRDAPRVPEPASAPPGASSPARALMQRLKEALDPQGVFARGRFHDGI